MCKDTQPEVYDALQAPGVKAFVENPHPNKYKEAVRKEKEAAEARQRQTRAVMSNKNQMCEGGLRGLHPPGVGGVSLKG